MKKKDKTVGFGAPYTFGAHIFVVEVPAARTQPVKITEVYGYDGEERGIPSEETRAVI